MKLKDVLDAFQRQLDAAAAHPAALGKLRPTHATLDLQVAVEQLSHTAPVSITVLGRTGGADAQTAGGHRLKIEFTIEGAAQPAAEIAAERISPTTTEATGLLPSLTAMFGAPGFDNAARASVFCEVVGELAPPQVAALIEAFREDEAEVPVNSPADPAVARARTRVGRLLKLGPSGFAGGVAAMLRVFQQDAPAPVLAAIRAHWKTQGDWIDAAPPGNASA